MAFSSQIPAVRTVSTFSRVKEDPLLSPAYINALQGHDKKAGAAFAGLRANEGLPGARKAIWLNAFLSLCHFLPLTGSIALHRVCGGHCKWLVVVQLAKNVCKCLPKILILATAWVVKVP